MRTSVVVGSALVLLASLAGCATFRDQLDRSQTAFEQNDDERTLALLRNLEGDMAQLSVNERARYAYLRGMSDYRIGYRVDAHHWLALALAYEQGAPGILSAEWKSRATEALDEMSIIVRQSGFTALAASPKPGEDVTQVPRAPSEREGRRERGGNGGRD